MHRILFVCLGNICRSPAAEGVLQHLAKELDFHVESCGLGDWHEGQLPDPRMRAAALERGIPLTSRAQAIHPDHFDRFDLILAADHSVVHELQKHASKPEQKAKIHLMTKFSPIYKDQEVPDPFYENQAAFELVMDMVQDCCEGLISELQNKK